MKNPFKNVSSHHLYLGAIVTVVSVGVAALASFSNAASLSQSKAALPDRSKSKLIAQEEKSKPCDTAAKDTKAVKTSVKSAKDKKATVKTTKDSKDKKNVGKEAPCPAKKDKNAGKTPAGQDMNAAPKMDPAAGQQMQPGQQGQHNPPGNGTQKQVEMLPANTCPDKLVRDEAAKMTSAVLKEKSYAMNKDVFDWVKANCNLAPASSVGASAGASGTASLAAAPVFTVFPVALGTRDRSGDFLFKKEIANSGSKLPFQPGGGNVTRGDGTSKRVPEIGFTLPVGTNIKAVMDGIITSVTYQDNDKDYEVWQVPSKDSPYLVTYDHVSNVTLKVGDSIKAGTIMGQVGHINGEFGAFELTVMKDANQPVKTFSCPVKFFEAGVQTTIKQQISQLMTDWKNFIGNQAAYDETKMSTPGCYIDSYQE